MMAFWIPHEIPLKKCPQSILVNFTPGPSYTLGKLGPWRVFNFPLKGAKHGEIGGTQRVGLSVCFWGFFVIIVVLYVRKHGLAKNNTSKLTE